MPTELAALAVATMLGFVHVIAAWRAASLQRGYGWTASARDELAPVTNGIAGRLERVRRNYVESFAFFAAAVLVVHAAGAESSGTAGAAWTFVVARTVYLIALPSGVSFMAWLMANIASLAILTLLLAPVVPYWSGLVPRIRSVAMSRFRPDQAPLAP